MLSPNRSTRPRASEGGFDWKSHLTSPVYYFQVALFFVLATPFELAAGSGFTYSVKLICAALLVLTSGSLQSVRLHISLILPAILAFIFLSVNIGQPTLRILLIFPLILMSTFLGHLRGRLWNDRFLAILTGFLTLHAAGLVLVFLNFLVLGSILDLHSLVFPGAARTESWGSFARISGFHVEPGTYAQWTLFALLLHALAARRLGTTFQVAIGLTVPLTLSLWGAVGAVVFFTSVFLNSVLSKQRESRMRRIAQIAFCVGMFGIAAAGLPAQVMTDILGFFALKATESNSGWEKIQATEAFFRALPNSILVGSPMVPGFCPYCRSINDVGLWANLVYNFGLFPIVVLIAVAARLLFKGWGLPFLILALLVLIWKAAFFDPLLWLLVSYVLRGPPLTLNDVTGGSPVRTGQKRMSAQQVTQTDPRWRRPPGNAEIRSGRSSPPSTGHLRRDD